MSNQLAARQGQLRPLIFAAQKQLVSLLQDKDKANKFMAASLVVASSPKLMQCSSESIVQSLVGVAMSDLSIDPNVGHCYIVPYGTTAQLQMGYKGFIQLLFRAGWLVKSMPVYMCDSFSMSFDGWDNHVSFSQNIDERDEGDSAWVAANLRGIYVIAKNQDTKDDYSLFVSVRVIEKLRKNSPFQKGDKPSGIWLDWYAEMAQAKAIKKLAKLLPIGDPRVQVAIASDDKWESGGRVDYSKTAEVGIVIDAEVADSPDASDDSALIGSNDLASSGADDFAAAMSAIKAMTGKESIIAARRLIALLPLADRATASAACNKRVDELRAAYDVSQAKVIEPEPEPVSADDDVVDNDFFG